MDRRIKKTEKAFKEALFYFLKKKELQKITVKELCDYADTNRGTFYLHYLDIYDLMDKVEQEMVDQFDIAMHDPVSLPENVLSVFESIKCRKDEYKILLVTRSSPGFVQKLTDKILQNSIEAIEPLQSEHDSDAVRNASLFLVGGAIALLRGWLENDCKTDPVILLRTLRFFDDYLQTIKNDLDAGLFNE